MPDLVVDAVARQGGVGVRVHTDQHPTATTLSTWIDGPRHRALFSFEGQRVNADDVRGVYLRRPRPPTLEHIDEPHRSFLVGECMAGLFSQLTSLPRARVLEHPGRLAVVEGAKLWQLQEAARAGLRIPRTLLSNDPDAIRTFIGDDNPARYICKAHNGFEATPPMYTRALSRDDLEAIDGVRDSPLFFQARIDKARELRVMMVDGQAFAGAIIAPQLVDWRASTNPHDFTQSPLGTPWHPTTLPDDVVAQLTRTLRALGLSTGAVDLIETPDGEHVFLEVNPAGEWGMLEAHARLPISDALATALLHGDRP